MTQQSKYLLLEGIPGGGKSTFILEAVENKEIAIVPDIGNPATLSEYFLMDWKWVLSVECLKSELGCRTKKTVCIQERGYISLLACHFSLEQLGWESTFESVVQAVKTAVDNGHLHLPTKTIIFDLSPDTSKLRQPSTRMAMWKNKRSLAFIRQFYSDYSKKPWFGESIEFICAEKAPQLIHRLIDNYYAHN